MIRRWGIPLITAALALGSLLAAAGPASASAPPSHPGTTRVRPGGTVRAFVPGGLMKHVSGHSSLVKGHRYQEESTNWSGYAATGNDGEFSSVSASWTQPPADCSNSDDEYAAFWVGLDGYNSDSVEQTGTDSDCDGSSPDYYGWYEMYPADPVYFSDPVEPGDTMSASVSFSGSETYTLVLTDYSQGWTENITQDEPGLARSSAEVITEAPSSWFGVLPLADFGQIGYGGSSVNGYPMGDYGPTSIIMVDSSGTQQDTTSDMDGYGDFSNTWLSSY